jgi:hypothetical protein
VQEELGDLLNSMNIGGAFEEQPVPKNKKK